MYLIVLFLLVLSNCFARSAYSQTRRFFFNREASTCSTTFLSSLSGPQDKSYVEARVYKTGAEKKRREREKEGQRRRGREGGEKEGERGRKREKERRSTFSICNSAYTHVHKFWKKKENIKRDLTHLWNRSNDISRVRSLFRGSGYPDNIVRNLK